MIKDLEAENDIKAQRYLELRRKAKERDQNLRNQSAAMHRRLKSQYLGQRPSALGESKNRPGPVHPNEDELNYEIAQNFREDVEDDFDSVERDVETGTGTGGPRQGWEDKKLDKEVAHLCSFMENLNIDQFVNEIEGQPVANPPLSGEDLEPQSPACGGQTGNRPPPHLQDSPEFGDSTNRQNFTFLRPKSSICSLLRATATYQTTPSGLQGSQTTKRISMNQKKPRVLSGILKSSTVGLSESFEGALGAVAGQGVFRTGSRLFGERLAAHYPLQKTFNKGLAPRSLAHGFA